MTLRPTVFAELLKQWLTAAAHPGISRVRTCADLGWTEQPCGVHIATVDGWALLLQVVRTSPAAGDPPPDDGDIWSQGADQRAARAVFDAEADRSAAKGGRPKATVTALLGVVAGVVQSAGHPGVAEAVVRDGAGGHPVLVATTTDGATLFGLPVGWFAPGAVVLQHAAHQIPADWY